MAVQCLVASVYPETPWDISTAFRNAHITGGMFTRQTCPEIYLFFNQKIQYNFLKCKKVKHDTQQSIACEMKEY